MNITGAIKNFNQAFLRQLAYEVENKTKPISFGGTHWLAKHLHIAISEENAAFESDNGPTVVISDLNTIEDINEIKRMFLKETKEAGEGDEYLLFWNDYFEDIKKLLHFCEAVEWIMENYPEVDENSLLESRKEVLTS